MSQFEEKIIPIVNSTLKHGKRSLNMSSVIRSI